MSATVESKNGENLKFCDSFKKHLNIETLNLISLIADEDLEDEEEEDTEAEVAIKTLNEKRNVVAFFYERLDKVATKIIASLTKVSVPIVRNFLDT